MRITTALLIGMLMLLGACGEEKTSSVAPKPIQTILFLDKSGSVGRDSPYVYQKYARFLEQMLPGNIRGRGDRLHIYYLHENTAKGHAYDFQALSTIEDTTELSPVDAEAARLDFTSALKVERQSAYHACMTHLHSPNKSASSRYTDIWGSMQVLAASTDTSAITKVYYLSDMIESMQGENRRDFHVRPPINRGEALRWASEDATHLQKRLPRLGWQSTELYMVLPFGPMNTTKENNPAVTHYWEELFRRLGVPGAITELHP